MEHTTTKYSELDSRNNRPSMTKSYDRRSVVLSACSLNTFGCLIRITYSLVLSKGLILNNKNNKNIINSCKLTL